ncbi:hypothetical protein FVEG_15140 [Fusarium verticillioides 7600]|uniref:Uncharacterized protein n=1 Tax=Gibberella moniliformis (strain M3125 / FGSC 7600) TaxID=334819 RepID=W7LZ05_GIBM7|nr:hypothetical protein FVEG_15140 [Fusarium verticillioides 7600]EWG40510.1 hypothetical protein FVEG_15140 [Fusarium verticillioides 7600]
MKMPLNRSLFTCGYQAWAACDGGLRCGQSE